MKVEKNTKLVERPIVLGRGGDGRLIETTLGELNSTLVSGTPGSGKSCLLQNIIDQSLNQAQVIVLDLKRISYIQMKGRENLTVLTDVNDGVKLFRKLSELMEKRYQLMERQKTDKCEAQRILVVVDEFAELTTYIDNNTHDQIRRILSLGRACNITMIVATQQASRRILTGALLDLFCSRIGLRQTSVYASKIAIEQSGCERLANYQALFRNQNGFLTQFQLLPPLDQETKDIDPNGFLDLSD